MAQARRRAAAAHAGIRRRRRCQPAAASHAGRQQRVFRLGAVDGAARVQVECLPEQDRRRTGEEPVAGRDAGRRLRTWSTRSKTRASPGRWPPGPDSTNGPSRKRPSPFKARATARPCGFRPPRHCPLPAPRIPNCRARGPGRAWTPYWTRSRAKARTAPPSTRSSGFPRSTNSSRRTPASWPCRAHCCGRA